MLQADTTGQGVQTRVLRSSMLIRPSSKARNFIIDTAAPVLGTIIEM